MTLICEYCGVVPHRMGCPEADGDVIKANKCSLCGCMTESEITANGEYICYACLEDIDLYDLMELYEVNDVTGLLSIMEERV